MNFHGLGYFFSGYIYFLQQIVYMKMTAMGVQGQTKIVLFLSEYFLKSKLNTRK